MQSLINDATLRTDFAKGLESSREDEVWQGLFLTFLYALVEEGILRYGILTQEALLRNPQTSAAERRHASRNIGHNQTISQRIGKTWDPLEVADRVNAAAGFPALDGFQVYALAEALNRDDELRASFCAKVGL